MIKKMKFFRKSVHNWKFLASKSSKRDSLREFGTPYFIRTLGSEALARKDYWFSAVKEIPQTKAQIKKFVGNTCAQKRNAQRNML